jgi:hypothetical protein
MVENAFPELRAKTGTGSILDIFRTRPDPATLLEKAAGELLLDYQLRKMLPRLISETEDPLARDWLFGHQLGEDDLRSLGFPPTIHSDQQEEKNARDVVLSILKLAGNRTKPLICFDELEAIQAGVTDATVIREFGALLTELVSQPGPKVVLTFVRPNTLLNFRKLTEKSIVSKAFSKQISIPPLTWEQTLRVVRCRLESESSVAKRRVQHPENPDWPLTKAFLEAFWQRHHRALTPRALIMACSTEFEKLRTPGGAEPGSDEDLPARFHREFEERRRKYMASQKGVELQEVLSLVLPWLVKVCSLPWIKDEDRHAHLADVHLIFHPESEDEKPVGVSFCNLPAKTIWHRFRRLNDQLNHKQCFLGSLMVVRSLSEPELTEAGKARLKTLTDSGAAFFQVSRQQLAELAAYKSLMTDTLQGDLVSTAGVPIAPQAYDRWVGENLSSAAKAFLGEIFADVSAKPAPTKASPKVGVKAK